MKLVSVDVGLRGCGVAVWDENKQLMRATYVKSSQQHGDGAEAWAAMSRCVWDWVGFPCHLAIETQQFRPQSDTPSRVASILQIQGVAGAIVGAVEPGHLIVNYLPSEWKGTVPPDLLIDRVAQCLSPHEQERIVHVGEKDHNTYDGCGVGLFFLKRMRRGGA